MCLDPDGAFARAKPKYFERITPDCVKPAIIFADGGAPLVVHRDGNLYYGSWSSANDPYAPGGLTVTRLSPDGKLTEFSPQLQQTLAGFNDGVTGLATAPDGALYVAARTAILKVNVTDGSVTTLIHPITLADCDDDPPDGRAELSGPTLRGLAVDAKGNVYVAAPGCHRVIKITPDGKASIILKSDRPWSPTGVALHDGEGSLYVLEYTNANGGPNENEGWLPRVRKLAPDGKVTTLVTITPEHTKEQK
jgi:sugar lactone lactonase YvrE